MEIEVRKEDRMEKEENLGIPEKKPERVIYGC